MSLLELKDQSTLDYDAGSDGEDLAKGSSYLLLTTVIAFVVVTAGITLFLLSTKTVPPAAGEVTQIWAHAVHTINTPVDAAGVQSAGEAFDQVLVLANVRVRNQGKEPIVLKDMLTNITLEDGIHSSYVATATDYNRIFIAYPELLGLHSHTLVRDTVIEPNGVMEGMVISAFHVSKAQWAARKDLNFTFAFKLHPNLTLVPKVAVTDL